MLGLVAQVLHEDAEILVLPQDLHLALVPGQDGAKVLVGVRQQVQDVRGTVLQRHLGILTQTHYLDPKYNKGRFECRAVVWRNKCTSILITKATKHYIFFTVLN